MSSESSQCRTKFSILVSRPSTERKSPHICSEHSKLNKTAIVLSGLGIFTSFGSAYSEYSRNVTSVPETVSETVLTPGVGDGVGNEKNEGLKD